MTAPAPMRLALVDDHRLFRKGLIRLIDMVLDRYEILFEADNGLDLQKKINPDDLPDIILMDVSMPGQDGFGAVEWLSEKYPDVNVLVVSMVEKEESVLRMLRLGVKGYLSKDVEPAELGAALNAVMQRGYYYTDYITGKLIHSLRHANKEKEARDSKLSLMNERERDFLVYACSEMTYNEIAAKMFLSPKTIDGYRNSLFEKLGVKSRVGLALFAVKYGLVVL